MHRLGTDGVRKCGVFWAGLTRERSRATREKDPSLSADIRGVADATTLGAGMLRRAVDRGKLTNSKDGLVPLSEVAFAPSSATSVAARSFAARRASGLAHLTASDVGPDVRESVETVRAVRQKTDQGGVGQLVFWWQFPAWVMRALCALSWSGRGPETVGWRQTGYRRKAELRPTPRLLGSLGRSRWAWHRKDGARLYVTSGKSREATRDPGGWRSP